MRRGVVWVPAALVIFAIAIMSAVIWSLDDRQTCYHSQSSGVMRIRPEAGTPSEAKVDFPYEEAFAACSRLINLARVFNLTPDAAYAYNIRGTAHLVKADFDRAIADFDQAILRVPKFSLYYYNRGTAYLAKADYDRAIADFDQAIRLDPKFSPAYNARGGARGSGKHDYDRALADLDLAIGLNPKNASAYFNRARTYESKGDYGRALTDYDQSLRLEPGNATASQDRERIAARLHTSDMRSR
jgi:tetratricopeptide (TPR) repeat protein